MEKNNKNWFLKILLAIVVILIVFVIALLWGGNQKLPSTSESSNILAKISSANAENSKLELTQNDINYLIRLVQPESMEKKGVKIIGLYTHIKSGEITIFSPISIKGLHFLISTKSKLSYTNDRIVIAPSSFKIGAVPMPKALVMGYLKRLNNDKVSVGNDEIFITTDQLPLKIKDIKIVDDKLELELSKTELVEKLDSIIDKEKEKYTPGGTNSSKSAGESRNSGKPKPVKPNERETVLKKTISQLDSARNSVKSSSSKKVIATAKTVVNKMLENPNYNYEGDILRAKAMYDRLDPIEKEKLKEAVFKNVDTKSLLRIYSNQK